MRDNSELGLTTEDHDKAFTEVSFLLEIFADTMRELVGSGAPTVGTTAGREMAKKMPIYLKDPGLPEVLAALQKRMVAGFEIESSCIEGKPKAEVTVGRCAIRDVCTNRGQEIGGELCTMFHYYFAGMASELFGKPLRPSITSAGERCVTQLKGR